MWAEIRSVFLTIAVPSPAPLSRTEPDMWLVSTHMVSMRRHVGDFGEDVWVREAAGEDMWGWTQPRISSERHHGKPVALHWHFTMMASNFQSQSVVGRSGFRIQSVWVVIPLLTQALKGHLHFQSLSFFLSKIEKVRMQVTLPSRIVEKIDSVNIWSVWNSPGIL